MLVRIVEIRIWVIVKLTSVLVKFMGYWQVVSNECGVKCPNKNVSLGVCWLGIQCVMYYWKFEQGEQVIYL